MTFNIYNILVIAGIIQGLIFTIIIPFNKKYQDRSTYFLVALIFSYSFSNLQYTLPDIKYMTLYEMYAYLFFPVASLIASTMYFFVILFLYPDKKIHILEKLLFAPFVIFTGLTLFYRLRILLNMDGVDPLNEHYYDLIVFQEVFFFFFNIVVLFLIFVQIFNYERLNKQFRNGSIRPDLKWLKYTLAVILFLTLLWGYLVYKNTFTDNATLFYNLWLGMAVLIYWLGHIGIYKYGILSERKKIRIYNSRLKKQDVETNSKNEHIRNFEKLMLDGKAYLDPKITLDSIAQQLSISPAYLSRTLKSELNISFTDYINQLRVNEAKLYLKNNEFSNYTMISVGLEAGFNSRSSFYNVFKKYTGKTPRAFRKDQTV